MKNILLIILMLMTFCLTGCLPEKQQHTEDLSCLYKSFYFEDEIAYHFPQSGPRYSKE